MDIQPAIFEYLCRYHQFGIPGLGELYWLFQPPVRKSDRELSPPSLTWDHKPVQKSASQFVSFLSTRANIPREKAQQIFDGWCEEKKRELDQGQDVIIEHIGTFSKSSDGVVGFTPFDHSEAFYQQDKWLEFSQQQRVEPVELLPMNDDLDEGTSWLEIILPIVLIGLIGLLVYFLWLSLKPEGRPPLDQQDPVVVDTLNQEISTQPDSFQATSDTVYGEIKDDTSEIESRDSLPIEATTDTVTPSTEDTLEEVVPLADSSEYTEEEVQVGEEDKIVRRAKEGECIVVVGSFLKQESVERAIEMVQKEGLTVYTEPYGEFTRVGVLFDCVTKDLYRTLFQLRGKFGQDAWVLKYK